MKKFFWKDKSGRGFSSKMKLKEILQLDNQRDWNDNRLHQWAKDAEVGDKWEDAANEFTCTKSK